MSYNSDNKFWCLWQSRNEINYPTNQLGWSDTLYKRLYSVVKQAQYDHSHDSLRKGRKRRLSERDNSDFHGGIFNLSFTPDGSLLLAATENKAILLYDPITHQPIRTVNKAHDASINYIKFIDDRIFATCSDDCTVALWDLRHLQQRLRVLKGHSYWVKNVEYEPRARSLISSSIDGCIYLWDINRYESTSFDVHQNHGDSESVFVRKPLYLSCLMRTRLTHDGSKMIIATSEGYVMIIHDLKLEHLEKDLHGFQSDLYRLMQKGHSCNLDFGSWFNPLFVAKRNRIELISDFPANNESNSIFSLDVHPHNLSIVSRNISRDEASEWTCVHDIQDNRRPFETFPLEVPKEGIFHPNHPSHPNPRVTVTNLNSYIQSEPSTSNHLPSSSSSSSSQNHRLSPNRNSRHKPSTLASSSESASSYSPPPRSPHHLSPTSDSIHNSPVVIISARTLNRRAHATILAPNASYRQIQPETKYPARIYKNIDRLTHYCEEPNVGTGYIKELCFSPDGRIICSPFESGVRLLSFNQDVSEYEYVVSDKPQPLHELKRCSYHNSLVVTSKFSPRNLLLASGCLEGEINFYQPIL